MTTIQDFLRVLRERWRILTSCVLLGLLVGITASLLQAPKYTATLSMYVTTQGDSTSSDAFQGAQLSAQRVKSYVELISSRRVAKDVIAKLGLTESPQALASQITASASLESVVIDVSVVDGSPDRAARLANTVGSVFTTVVDQIERPITPNGSQIVAVRVVEPADSPSAPSSIGIRITAALGLLAGVVIGVIAAMVRNALDASVKSPEQLRAASGVPNLGSIAHDSAVRKNPLTMHDDPQSPRAEAFRQLRTNLQFIDVGHPRKVIVVSSSMPDEGKTTTVVNLAIAIASARRRVLVIDGDLRRPTLADTLGLDQSIGLTSVLTGRVSLEQAIQPWGNGTIDVLASGMLPPNPSELLASRDMEKVLTDLRRSYDVVLIDSPPLLPVTDAAAVAPATDGVLLVCRYKETTRAQVESAAEALRSVSAQLLGTVFTMVPGTGPRAYARYHGGYQADLPDTSLPEVPVQVPGSNGNGIGHSNGYVPAVPTPAFRPSPGPRKPE